MKFIHKLMLESKSKRVLSGIGVLALVLFTTLLVFEATKKEIVIVADGEEQVVHTHKETVEELFSEAGIKIGDHDALSHQEDAPIEDGMTIDYKTAKQVTVTVDGTSESFYTTEDTILAFFKEHDLSFTEHDELSHSLEKEIEDGLEIQVKKAFDVAVNDAGEEFMVPATGGTVEELLQASDIEWNDKDKITPSLNETVTKDTTIDIVRVTTETVEVAETVDFETEKKEDDTLLKGKENVISQGEEGQVVKKYKVTKENGEEVSRELVEEKVIKESKNRVVAVGTKVPVQQASTESNGNLVQLSSKSSAPSGGKTLTVTASAFTASCGGCSGVTSTGINLKANPNQKVIAVDPNVIPLGTRVWVEGYGEAVAGDTGGAIRGNRIDVHVPNKGAAYQWGVRTVQVKILD